MKFNDTLTDVISIDLEMDIVPALMGEPGIGKSSFVEELARTNNTLAFVLPCNQLADKADLTGARLVPTADGKSYSQVFYPHHVVQEAIEYAVENPNEFPILFLDEINRTTSDVTSAALTLVTLRRMGSVELPDNLRLMIAGNNKGNVTTLDEASLSRFAIYNVEPDAATLVNLLGDGLNPWVKEVLVRFPKMVFAKSAPKAYLVDGKADDDDDKDSSKTVLMSAEDMLGGEEMLQLTTPRTIDAVSRWLNRVPEATLQEYLQTAVRIDDRDTTLLNEVLEGHIGNTDFTTQLVANISASLSNGGAGKPVQRTVPKPRVYSQLKAATSASALQGVIGSMTDRDKSGALLYALYEKADNKRLIEELASATSALQPEHNKELVQLATNDGLDKGNVEAFLGTGTPAADNLNTILGMFV